MRSIRKPKKADSSPARRLTFPARVRALGAYDSPSRRFVYLLADPRERETVRYAGCSVGIRKRYQAHIWEARFPYDANSSNVPKVLFLQQLLSDGVFPEMRLIEEVSADVVWMAREKYWIDRFRSPNLTNFERQPIADAVQGERRGSNPGSAGFIRRSQ
jgi:hypothetical protein